MAEEIKTTETTEVKKTVKKTAAKKAEAETASAPAVKKTAVKKAAAETAEAKPAVKAEEVKPAEAKPEKPAKKAAKTAEKLLKITLIKSTSNCKKDQIATCEALGLKKIRQFNILKDNAATRGMIYKVRHLITVSEVIQEA